MINPHPPLSSFPIVISLLLVVSELLANKIETKKISNFLLLMLVVFSAVTFISGYFGFDYAGVMTDKTKLVVDLHQSLAKIHLIILLFFGLLYSLKYIYQVQNITLEIAYYSVFLLMIINILYLGYLGGELVFNHGAGVLSSNNTPS